MSRSIYLTTPEAAELLGMKPSTLEAWRHRGGGPKFLKFGRTVKYRQQDLDDWVEGRVRANTLDSGDGRCLS